LSAAARIDRAVGGGIFGIDAAGYDDARANYPDALFERLQAYAGDLGGRAIFEVGAGTGIASRALRARGPGRLTLIEPDAVLAGRLANEGFEAVCAPFETAALPCHAYDAGVAASSIHWVDPVHAHRRAHALLRAGGTWAIWWNVYRERGIGDAFADALLPRLAGFAMPPSEAADHHYSLDQAAHRAALLEAGFGAIEHHVWRRERLLSGPEMTNLYATFSFVRALPAAARTALLEMIGGLVEKDFGGRAPNVVLTPLYLARALGPSE
jgi:SAM-dependent methyltransferase